VPSHRTPTQHLKSRKCRLPPLLGGRNAQEDLVDDDPGSDLRHRDDSLDPRRLQRAEFRPMLTSPSGAIWIPAAEACMDAGIASVSVSVPKASQGSGSMACRHRAIPDFPELDPPLRMIT
jgi:hypothetical protein